MYYTWARQRSIIYQTWQTIARRLVNLETLGGLFATAGSCRVGFLTLRVNQHVLSSQC